MAFMLINKIINEAGVDMKQEVKQTSRFSSTRLGSVMMFKVSEDVPQGALQAL